MKKKPAKTKFELVRGLPGSVCACCHTDTSYSTIVEESRLYGSGRVVKKGYCWQCVTGYEAAALMREAVNGWLKIDTKEGMTRLVLADRPELIFGYGRG